jgi:hypothetical protein
MSPTQGNFVVRRIAADGTINTVAGNGNPKFAGDNGPATSAQIDPVAVAVDSQGNLYIADGLNYRIRKVDTTGIITTIAGNGNQGVHWRQWTGRQRGDRFRDRSCRRQRWKYLSGGLLQLRGSEK